jgi:hypothetical protein
VIDFPLAGAKALAGGGLDDSGLVLNHPRRLPNSCNRKKKAFPRYDCGKEGVDGPFGFSVWSKRHLL